MASIKNLKSKGRAVQAISIGLDLDARPNGEWRIHSTEYDYRKAQFADLPPAKLDRPLRAVRGAYKQALEAWDRAVHNGGAALYPYAAEGRYRTALIAAAAGKGHLVRRLAA